MKITINSNNTTEHSLLYAIHNFTEFILNISFIKKESSLIINNNSFITFTTNNLIITNNLFTVVINKNEIKEIHLISD